MLDRLATMPQISRATPPKNRKEDAVVQDERAEDKIIVVSLTLAQLYGVLLLVFFPTLDFSSQKVAVNTCFQGAVSLHLE